MAQHKNNESSATQDAMLFIVMCGFFIVGGYLLSFALEDSLKAGEVFLIILAVLFSLWIIIFGVASINNRKTRTSDINYFADCILGTSASSGVIIMWVSSFIRF